MSGHRSSELIALQRIVGPNVVNVGVILAAAVETSPDVESRLNVIAITTREASERALRARTEDFPMRSRGQRWEQRR